MRGLPVVLSETQPFVTAPRKVPFSTVRLRLPLGIGHEETRGRILYVPGRRLWRVNPYGYPVRFPTPGRARLAFERAIRHLRPRPPSATWRCARR